MMELGSLNILLLQECLPELAGTKRGRVAQPEQAMMGVPHLAKNKE